MKTDGVSEMTQEQLTKLRKVAEATTPGPLTMHPCEDARYAAFVDAPHLGPDSPELAVFLNESDARFYVAFDRDTVLAMLDEIERMLQEREVLMEILMPAREALSDLDKSYYRVEKQDPGGYVMGSVSVKSLVTVIESTRKVLTLIDGGQDDGGVA